MRLFGLILLLLFTIAVFFGYQTYLQSSQMEAYIRAGDLAFVKGDYLVAKAAYEKAQAMQLQGAVAAKLNEATQIYQEEQRLLKQGQVRYENGGYLQAIAITDPIKNRNDAANLLHINAHLTMNQYIADSLFMLAKTDFDSLDYGRAFVGAKNALLFNTQHSQARQLLLAAHQQIMAERLRKDIRPGKTRFTTRPEPPQSPEYVPPPDDLTYQIMDQAATEDANATELRTFVVVRALQSGNVEKTLNHLFLKQAYQAGFKYHDYATDIVIFAFHQPEDYQHDRGSWFASLTWNRLRDGGKPHIVIR